MTVLRTALMLLVLAIPVHAQTPPLTVVPQVRYGQGQAVVAVWSPDGKTLAVGGSAGVWIYDAADWTLPPASVGSGYGVSALAFSPAGTWLAVGRADGTGIAARADGTGSGLYTIAGPVPERGAMRNFNVPARFVTFVAAGTPFDNTARPGPVVSTQTVFDGDGTELRLVVAVFMEDMPETSPVQPGGTLTFSIEPLRVTIRDSETGETVAILDGFTGPVYHAVFDSDADYLEAFSPDGTIIRYVAATGETDSIRAGDFVPAAFDTPVVALGAGGRLRAESPLRGALTLTRADGSTTELVPAPADVRSLEFDSTGTRLAVGQRTGTLRVFDTVTGIELFGRYKHFGHITDILWAMGDSLIITAGEDTIVMLTDPITGEERGRFQAHNDVVTVLAIHPQASSIFVSGSLDGTAAMWFITPPE